MAADQVPKLDSSRYHSLHWLDQESSGKEIVRSLGKDIFDLRFKENREATPDETIRARKEHRKRLPALLAELYVMTIKNRIRLAVTIDRDDYPLLINALPRCDGIKASTSMIHNMVDEAAKKAARMATEKSEDLTPKTMASLTKYSSAMASLLKTTGNLREHVEDITFLVEDKR